MPGVDFSKYHTYKWVTIEGATYPNQIVDAQIKQSVDSQLATKGLTKTDGDKADLLIGYQASISTEKQWNAYGTGGFAGVVAWLLLKSQRSPPAHWCSTCTIPLPNNSFGLAARVKHSIPARTRKRSKRIWTMP